MSFSVDRGARRKLFCLDCVHLAVAALAMVATLPGRTHGLGMITERLLRDFPIGRVQYATINLWATLFGAFLCLPVGKLIDRLGSRVVLTGVSAALGVVVLAMGCATTVSSLFVAITLTRGFGQSALSVASLASVGKRFSRRIGPAMGVYSLLVGLGFMLMFRLGDTVRNSGWRTVLTGLGLILLCGLAPLVWLLLRDSSNDGELYCESRSGEQPAGSTLQEALRTPAFWVFALASSTYALIASGISLFNESILGERGFSNQAYYRVLTLTAFVALASNFAAGWLARRWPMGRLMGIAMVTLAGALVGLPHVNTSLHVDLYAIAMGMAGGIITVLFFAVWGHAFGQAHLGKIQGLAQMLTVLASAVGPLLLAECQRRTGSYIPLFCSLAPIIAVLGLSAWYIPLPSPQVRRLSASVIVSPNPKPGALNHVKDES